MPANLTAPYKVAESAYKAAVTREEKLAALEEMLRAIPKHKGTEKMQADLRARISRLKKEPTRKSGARGPSHRIPREGGGQVVLVGPPNAGKSALVAHLTRADPTVAEYPMTTRDATPGMMPFGDIAFQLIDLPPLCDEHVENWVYDLVRAADLAWIVLSIGDPLDGLETMDRLLAARAIQLVPATMAGAEARGNQHDPHAAGLAAHAADRGAPTPIDRAGATNPATAASPAAADSDAPDDRRPGWTYLPAFLVVTGMDLPGAHDDLEAFEELVAGAWPRVGVSAVSGLGLARLGEVTFDALHIIRVYTREPGHDPDMDRPFTLPIGATVGDLARAIHGEVAEQLSFARVWGAAAFDGQRVTGGHRLADGDVVELRT